ncbi:MAG: ComF family protein [Cetobacterium sp.]|uniref:ComF family protein n=1 Tax=Cetobacterium sp. TaxID=2071632 RepID=UPI003F3679C1
MLKQLLRKLFFDNTCSLCNCSLKTDEYICFKCNLKLEKMSILKKRKNLYYLYYYIDVKKIIFDFKFKNRKSISEDLKKYIKKAIEDIIKIEEIDVIISIPISKNRLLERGYNQVDELLKSSNISFDSIERIKNTKQMYKIKDKIKRMENVEKAFHIKQNYCNKKILIVDDIITTGSTLKELERELKEKHSVEKVVFFTVAVVGQYFK